MIQEGRLRLGKMVLQTSDVTRKKSFFHSTPPVATVIRRIAARDPHIRDQGPKLPLEKLFPAKSKILVPDPFWSWSGFTETVS